MKKYICYDIRGIQQYIFSIPQLQYIIGGSLVIADFDREWERIPDGVETIFTGGGKGIFCVEECKCRVFLTYLEKKACFNGLDIRLGVADTFTGAMASSDNLHPYLPDANDLDGYPCEVSGLWPVAKGKGEGPKKGIHPKVYLRIKKLKADYFTETFLAPGLGIYTEISGMLNGHKPEFLTHVSGEDDVGIKDVVARGQAGDHALGLRRRWAVVAMDGNDMGTQFRCAVEQENDNENARDRIACMSRELAKECTLKAFEKALKTVVLDWAADADLKKCTYHTGNEARVVLPFRPLILGGDDILLLTHCSYALKFVRIMSEAFTKESKKAARRIKDEKGFDLWPATNGTLTISAGIAYTGVTYPLHTSIPYAENLLANAKEVMRKRNVGNIQKEPGEPVPAAVDWEHITETLIDTPAARRSRELIFFDGDLNMKIELTRKPYQISNIHDLVDTRCKNYKKIPGHVRASLKSILMKPWALRSCELTGLECGEKETRELVADLQLYDFPKSIGPGWQLENTATVKYLSTDILDVISLIDEEHRMAQVKGEGGVR